MILWNWYEMLLEIHTAYERIDHSVKEQSEDWGLSIAYDISMVNRAGGGLPCNEG